MLRSFFFLPMVALPSCAVTSTLPDTVPGATLESITVTSRTFSSGGTIPIDNTCDGKNTSPDVTWSSPPEGTKALVITFDDQEPGRTSGSRWLVVNVSPDARILPPGADVGTVGGKLGLNGDGETSYSGPCTPRHERHHIVLRVIALDKPLRIGEPKDRATVFALMNGHVLGAGELVGIADR